MLLDVLGLLSACSYALDCVEAECKRRSEENSDNAVPGIFIPGISFVLKETPE